MKHFVFGLILFLVGCAASPYPNSSNTNGVIEPEPAMTYQEWKEQTGEAQKERDTKASKVAKCDALVKSPANQFGSAPKNPESGIKATVEMALRDPFSAQYKFGKPVKAVLYCNGDNPKLVVG